MVLSVYGSTDTKWCIAWYLQSKPVLSLRGSSDIKWIVPPEMKNSVFNHFYVLWFVKQKWRMYTKGDVYDTIKVTTLKKNLVLETFRKYLNDITVYINIGSTFSNVSCHSYLEHTFSPKWWDRWTFLVLRTFWFRLLVRWDDTPLELSVRVRRIHYLGYVCLCRVDRQSSGDAHCSGDGLIRVYVRVRMLPLLSCAAQYQLHRRLCLVWHHPARHQMYAQCGHSTGGRSRRVWQTDVLEFGSHTPVFLSPLWLSFTLWVQLLLFSSGKS